MNQIPEQKSVNSLFMFTLKGFANCVRERRIERGIEKETKGEERERKRTRKNRQTQRKRTREAIEKEN